MIDYKKNLLFILVFISGFILFIVYSYTAEKMIYNETCTANWVILNAEKVLTQTTSWVLNSRYVNVNSVSKVNVKSKVKNSYISRSVNDEFSLTDDEINSFKETLVLSSIDSLSKLVLNNPLSVLFTSTVRRNNNRAKMNVEFDSWICTRCC
ncbi:hypothetical protein AB9C70_10870 [Escherichia coli]